MKNLLSILLLVLITSVSFSQRGRKMDFRFWDAKGQAVADEKDAKFFTTVQKINDTTWQHQKYEMMGPLLTSEQFKDKNGKIHHGRSSFMRTGGTLDSTGYYTNGELNGEWLYFDKNGILIDKMQYITGEPIPISENGGESQGGSAHDTPETPAQLPGGATEWTHYLIRNLRYPQYAIDNKIIGNVKFYFLVDEKGRVQDDIILKSVEFSLDNEARRLILESPKWKPATQSGKNIKSYVQQGVQFRLEGTWK